MTSPSSRQDRADRGTCGRPNRGVWLREFDDHVRVSPLSFVAADVVPDPQVVTAASRPSPASGRNARPTEPRVREQQLGVPHRGQTGHPLASVGRLRRGPSKMKCAGCPISHPICRLPSQTSLPSASPARPFPGRGRSCPGCRATFRSHWTVRSRPFLQSPWATSFSASTRSTPPTFQLGLSTGATAAVSRSPTRSTKGRRLIRQILRCHARHDRCVNRRKVADARVPRSDSDSSVRFWAVCDDLNTKSCEAESNE